MIATLSPAVSWLLFLACVAVGALVYIAIAGGRRYRRMEEQALHPTTQTWVNPDDANIRIFGGPYDAVERGTSMLEHADDHDPILGDEWDRGCAACLAARNSTFAQLRKIEPGLGPCDPSVFIARMQEMAREHLRLVTS